MTAPVIPTVPPFTLEHRIADVQGGSFVPDAAVLVTPTLRTTGLLAALDGEDWQVLLGVLSCVTANGTFVATPELIGAALGVAPSAALDQLRRLASTVWRGAPLLIETLTESGLRLFALSPHLLVIRHAELPAAGNLTLPELPAGNRDAVVAHSRATYGRPRAEVEAEIERFLSNGLEIVGAAGVPGSAPLPEHELTPEQAERRRLWRRLTAHAVPMEQADRLLDTCPLPEIQRQLDWLPYRRVRNPAGFLVAAIEGNYEPPVAVRKASAPLQTLAENRVHPVAPADSAGANIGAGSPDANGEREGTSRVVLDGRWESEELPDNAVPGVVVELPVPPVEEDPDAE